MARAGFTLVEGLVILAILAVVSGSCFTVMARLIPSAHLNHATRSLISLCRHGRIEAIKTNRRVHLTCDSTANVCRLTTAGGNRLIAEIDFSTLEHSITITKSLKTDFTGRGRATRTGTVVVCNAAGETRSVVVRLSGGVTIK